MAKQEAVVVGCGMMTAVGLSAAETAASVRAALMRFTAIDWFDDRFEEYTIAEVPDDGTPDLADALLEEPMLTAREERLLRLASAPLAEATSAFGDQSQPPALFLALPEPATTIESDPDLFLDRLSVQTEAGFDRSASRVVGQGRAGGLMAIGEAVREVTGGARTCAVAGAVDSFRDLYLLGTLDQQGRVKSTRNLDGFVPGEGAGFVAIATRSAAESAGLPILAVVSTVATGLEPGHRGAEEPYRGDGLAETFAGLLDADPPDEAIREVYSSMNGESYWAKEWGVAFLRHSDAFDPEPGMWHPADCFGDTGAAHGPLMVAIASLGIAEGYRRSPALVYASSDGAERAALWIAAP